MISSSFHMFECQIILGSFCDGTRSNKIKGRLYCSLMDEHAMCDVDDLLLRLLLGLAGLTSLLPSWISNLFWIKYQIIEIHGSMNKYQNLFCWQRNFQPCQLFLSSSLLFWPWHKLKSADNRCNTNFAISQT